MSILIDEGEDMNVQKCDACISASISQGRHKSILKSRINLKRSSITAKGILNKRIRKRVSFADGNLVKLVTIINPNEHKNLKFDAGKDSKLKSSNKSIKSCSCSIF